MLLDLISKQISTYRRKVFFIRIIRISYDNIIRIVLCKNIKCNFFSKVSIKHLRWERDPTMGSIHFIVSCLLRKRRNYHYYVLVIEICYDILIVSEKHVYSIFSRRSQIFTTHIYVM